MSSFRCMRASQRHFASGAGLSPATMNIIHATTPAVAANITAITEEFYPIMFANNPEVLAFFNLNNQRSKRQPQALSNAVVAAVTHLDDLSPIDAALNLIAHKHCALGVLPDHYRIVHDNFLKATAKVLGDAVTPEVGKAWSEVLMAVAQVLIDREAALYAKAAWSGARAFKVTSIVDEGNSAKSFYLKPVDGKTSTVTWLPGQYVSVTNKVGKESVSAPRHYSISHHKEFRITPKKADQGLMSTHLHDNVKVGDELTLHAPFGEFTRDALPAKSTEVYLAGGIGITPLMAMMGASDAANVALVHADDDHHVLQADTPASVVAVRGTRGILDTFSETLNKKGINVVDANVFLCGPVGFMSAAMKSLNKAGVANENIHFEAFGPRPTL